MSAERIKSDLDAQLAAMKTEIHARLEEARVSGEKEKDFLIQEARAAAGVIVESAKKEIEAEKAEAVRDLKNKVAELSVLAAEHILMKNPLMIFIR